jgi:hypothetical protein
LESENICGFDKLNKLEKSDSNFEQTNVNYDKTKKYDDSIRQKALKMIKLAADTIPYEVNHHKSALIPAAEIISKVFLLFLFVQFNSFRIISKKN